MEVFLVGRLAELQWRLLRVPRLEAAILSATQTVQEAPKDNFEAIRIRLISECHQNWKKILMCPKIQRT